MSRGSASKPWRSSSRFSLLSRKKSLRWARVVPSLTTRMLSRMYFKM
jgi:hypothetical protein